ncbi:NUDIX hydrolase family protein [Nocardioidaceae bacterium SCSIO 66511]|nr:NUDIX hydrolase family protein [Nocardioidaceae bacterium SCSIO 66511]
MSSVRTPDPNNPPEPAGGWLTEGELAETRSRVPILYVEAVPVRVDADGAVSEVGTLLRASMSGEMTRTLVSGRVLHGETIRDALRRHLEKDIGPAALPQIPASTVPFGVAEYFPWPGESVYSDERQHAVALAYVVPVSGDCTPAQDALALDWMRPRDIAREEVLSEMEGGRGALVRQALASVGLLG